MWREESGKGFAAETVEAVRKSTGRKLEGRIVAIIELSRSRKMMRLKKKCEGMEVVIRHSCNVSDSFSELSLSVGVGDVVVSINVLGTVQLQQSPGLCVIKISPSAPGGDGGDEVAYYSIPRCCLSMINPKCCF